MLYIFLLNLGFAIFEFFGGIWTGSTTLQADSIHDFGDALVLGVAYLLEKKSKMQASAHATYGYKRLNIFSSLVMGVVLVAGSLYIFAKSFYHVIYPNDLHIDGMLLFAIVGISVNLGSFIILSKMGITHSHGLGSGECGGGSDHADHQHHNHSHSKNHSQEAMKWHLLEDLFGWVSLLVLSIVLRFVDLPILDPILSIIISIFILKNVLKMLKPIILILLQAVPDHQIVKDIKGIVGKIDAVKGYHDFHIWSLDGLDHVLTIHLIVEKQTKASDFFKIKSDFKNQLKKYGKIHSTIEIEIEGDVCDHARCVFT